MLDQFYFADPRVILVPIEHLSPDGMSTTMATLIETRRPGATEIVRMLNEAFPRYWERTADLATRSRTWPTPRRRNIAIVDHATDIPPFIQLLNTSTWTLFDCDFAQETSSIELLAYLLVQGDRMSLTGEATMAAIHNAAYWFDRTPEEIADFQRGARATTRPDADAYDALADSIPWFQQVAHETLRPPPSFEGYRAIPRTGLLVPIELQEKPVELTAKWTDTAKASVDTYFRRYRGSDRNRVTEILEWLRVDTAEVVVTGRKNRILWDPNVPERVGSLRNELKNAGPECLDSILADLQTIDAHTRTFRERAIAFEELPCADDDLAQDGYTYLYRGRRMLAYNLFEPHIERLRAPALPYARAMLGARAFHEWSHLAVDAGWVTTARPVAEHIEALNEAFDRAIQRSPEAVRAGTRNDLAEANANYPRQRAINWGGETIASDGESHGAALLRMLLPRFADYKANLLATEVQSPEEREAYVRQNIRTLRAEYAPAQMWRMIARYLYELQYLRFSEVADRLEYFLTSTWFDSDFVATEIVSASTLAEIDEAFGKLLACFTVDRSKFPESQSASD